LRVVTVGAGMMGLCTAMLLARDGHEVTVLERDAEGPPDPATAFDGWERRGVNQFRLAHLFLSRFRQLAESELPDLPGALEAGGALRYNVVANIPDEMKGGSQPGDDRFDLITGRRATVEAATARLAESTPGVSIRRGAPVEGLVTGTSDRPGVPHVTGVRLESGEQVPADLVVDAGGRRSPLPRWLAGIGARAAEEELEDCGFVYYGRHFRSGDGEMPVMIGPLKQDWGSIGVLTLPADNGTWSVTLTASSNDPALRALRDPEKWTAVARLLPLTAHWIDAVPIEPGVVSMSKIEDRIRDLAPGDEPVVTGVVTVADAWACTNPSLGRGASVGLMHAVALRDHLRKSPGDPWELARDWARTTRETVEPWYRTTLRYDRHRLREIDAVIDGTTYRTDDEFWSLNHGLEGSALADGDMIRAVLDMAMVLRHPDDVLGDDGLRSRLRGLQSEGADGEPTGGPTRADLLAAIA